ncbi:MAG TPA: tetratricopeptide repeat protein [bacterium (Candidatus Stahlbacteria)]|nr:tetratricopeptide repeat protein [Candidatus Stahlbacteria bacterium]
MDLQTKRIYERGLAFYEKGEIAKALSDLESVAMRYPKYADVHNALGLTYSMSGRYGKAVQSFKKAVEINPEYIEAYINLAISLNELSRFEEAIQAFETAAKLETKEKGPSPKLRAEIANTYARLGDTYCELQEYRKARNEYRRALKTCPEYLDVKTKLAHTYIATKNYKRAVAILKEVVEANSEYIEAYIILGLAHYQLGNNDEAKEAWDKVLAIDHENPKARAYLTMMESNGGSA